MPSGTAKTIIMRDESSPSKLKRRGFMLKKGRDWRQAAEKPFYRLRGGGKLSERPLLSLRGSSPKTGAIFGRVVPFPPCGWRHLGASPTPLTGGLHLHTFAANFGFCVAVHRESIPFRPLRIARSSVPAAGSQPRFDLCSCRVRAAAEWHIHGSHCPIEESI